MRALSITLVTVGLVFLAIAGIGRIMIGRPYLLLGVRALSLISLANSAFLLAALIKLSEKK